MDYPLSSLITQPSAPSQRAFAEEVASVVRLPSEHAHPEPTDEGLRLWAVTELDLEIAVDALRKLFPAARQGKPEVAYIMHPEFLEPCYIATLQIPGQSCASVLADLGMRRGVIKSVNHSSESSQVVAELPVSESFGYSTSLRSLTQRKGTVTFSRGGLRKAGSSGLNDDAA
jgi:translation elongation factor EF-G